MAGPTRLELATSGVTGRRSNQLNYDPVRLRASTLRRDEHPWSLPAIASVTLACLPASKFDETDSRLVRARRIMACLAEAHVASEAARLRATAGQPSPDRERRLGGKGLEPLTAGV